MPQYCRYFIQDKGCRYGNGCQYSHDPADVPMCRYWSESTICARGDKCWFPHGDRGAYEKRLRDREFSKHFQNKRINHFQNQRRNIRKQRQERSIPGVPDKEQLDQLMFLSRVLAENHLSDDDDSDYYYGGDIWERDLELYEMKHMLEEFADNCPTSDAEEEEMAMFYGDDYSGGSGEEEYYGQDDDDDDEFENGNKPTEKTESLEKGPCLESNCKRLRNRACNNKMCKACCVMTWPTVCSIHELDKQPKKSLNKYLDANLDKSSEKNEVTDMKDIAMDKLNRKTNKDETSRHFSTIPSFKSFVEDATIFDKLSQIHFHAQFDIKDEHLISVADKCSKLTSLYLGDTETGHGVSVTDAAVYYLAEKCVKLEKLSLISCTSVSDHSVEFVFSNCTELKELAVTGHDKTNGKIRGLCLLGLIRDTDSCSKLKKIDFDAQSLEPVIIMKFKRARRSVKITNNEIWGDSMADMMVRQEMYGGDSDCCLM